MFFTDPLFLGFLFGILFALPLVAAAVMDIKTMKIPGTAYLIILALGVVRIILHGISPPTALYGLLFCGILLLMISLIADGIGGGDIKLFACAGFFLGLNGALAALFSSFFLFLCVTGGKRLFRQRNKTTLPFAPYIAAGALISYTLIILGVIAN